MMCCELAHENKLMTNKASYSLLSSRGFECVKRMSTFIVENLYLSLLQIPACKMETWRGKIVPHH